LSIARILIIAGSDSGGGAGIQADIKAVTMLGGHAMTAITAITAQNTQGVQGVHPVPTDMVIAQMDSVIADIGVDAVKIGMIGSAETAAAVAARLAALDGVPIVFDPVMVATSGSTLADGATIAAFEKLMRIATVTTPNLPELEALGGVAAVTRLGGAVLAKGGHGAGNVLIDRLHGPDGLVREWSDPRIDTPHTHGTGCTLGSAIACGLGQGRSLTDAITVARRFVRMALREAPGLGGGHGPMGHQAVRLDEGPSLRLNQVTIGSNDYAASVRFYRLLGLRQIVDAAPHYARFETPGGATLSIHAQESDVLGGASVYFECDDLDGTVARLDGLGIAFDGPPVDQRWLWREAWTTDPGGNRLCLFSAGEARRFPPWRIEG